LFERIYAMYQLKWFLVLTAAGSMMFGSRPVTGQFRFRILSEFPAKEARQGVAVDGKFIYVVHSQRIGRYDKRTFKKTASWQEEANGPIEHLDSGVIHRGRLYCAHSNYPKMPMTSSVEIWDASSLTHIKSHSFGIYRGSCTWIDRYNGTWWAAFAHYDKWKHETGRGTEWTSVVKLNDRFEEIESWTLPDTVIERMRPMSNSGGSWGPDGKLYLTGHDRPEVYVLEPPVSGSRMRLVDIRPAPFLGQGVAWDRSEKTVLYGIRKKDRKVMKTKMIEEE
jgi:hypothetical protein